MKQYPGARRSTVPLPVQILLTLLLAAVVVIGGFIAWLALIMLGVKQFSQLLAGLGLLIVAGFLVTRIWGLGRLRTVSLVCGVLLGAVLLTGTGYGLYNRYIDGIPTVGSEVDLNEYRPFAEDSRLIQPEPASLQLEGELPRLDGATALYPIYAAAAEAVYPAGEYPWYEGPVQCNKTDAAFERLIAGEADLILTAGPSDEQLSNAAAAEVELELTPVGREAFVFFVNQANPVEELSLEQIQGIYSGRITGWEEVGGKREAIRAFQRPQNSGSQTALQRLMGDVPIMAAEEEEIISGMGGILRRTADYKNYGNAIGYSFRFYASEMAAQNTIRFLRIDGVYPDADSVRDGSYPVSNQFYVITRKGEETENTRLLKEWFLSPEGQRLIEQVGYLPLA